MQGYAKLFRTVLAAPSMLAMVASLSFCFAVDCTSALAQNQNDFLKVFTGIMQPVAVQAAQTEWRKLSQNELSCMDQTLRERGSDLRTAIRQGTMPSDARIADVRAACRLSIQETVGMKR